MNIEHALSLCGPKSASSIFACHDVMPTYQQSRSGSTPVTQARKGNTVSAGYRRHGDILLALGVVQAREALGLSLILARYDKDVKEKRKAIAELANIAFTQAPGRVGKAAGRNSGQCMVLLATLAVEHYCRTADDPRHRCRCGGRGNITDMAASKAAGKTVEKACPRCGGSGLKPVTSASVYKVVKTLVPELTQRTWSRNWKVFYDDLLSRCHQEVNQAESLFSAITKAV